jgi:hypothetical protein
LEDLQNRGSEGSVQRITITITKRKLNVSGAVQPRRRRIMNGPEVPRKWETEEI